MCCKQSEQINFFLPKNFINCQNSSSFSATTEKHRAKSIDIEHREKAPFPKRRSGIGKVSTAFS
jgi:hypothetical protein